MTVDTAIPFALSRPGAESKGFGGQRRLSGAEA